MVAYSYQKPPMYDSTINHATLRLLSFAPILYVISAAWTYSNQQVFMNKVVANTDTSLYPPTEHLVSQFFTQITPGTPFIIPLIAVVCMLIFSWLMDRFFDTKLSEAKSMIVV